MIFKLHIEQSITKLMEQEDTDKDNKITIEDSGPKAFEIASEDGKKSTVKGTYHLSNLLQELVLAKQEGKDFAEIDLNKIEELPTKRISRMIRDYYWDGLTRTMDSKGIRALISDTKNISLVDSSLRIYVPYNDTLALDYYNGLVPRFPIEVIRLPNSITPEYVKSINDKPGILSLKLNQEKSNISGAPFVVPGGRFNEMYGWDSYFESIGLLIDQKIHLAIGMADNFQYEIEHYGKILNANRSYYLTRTQPPFYTSLIKEIYIKTKDKSWLKSHLSTAIKEYESVWMVEGERLTDIGLNRYLANGIGIPPETEEGHFDAAIKPYADAVNMSIEAYVLDYQKGNITNEELDMYFIHDRSMRESGHDTSNRLDGKCAFIIPVELNAMLYKYEIDIAQLIEEEFDGKFSTSKTSYNSEYWKGKASVRQALVTKYLWNSEKGLYLDYNINSKKQEPFLSATTFAPLWSGMSSESEAEALIKAALPLLKEKGGLAACDKKSRGLVNAEHPQRQWDYPNGWAPHQMMLWTGLLNYGYHDLAEEMIYRWLFMITKNAVDYNGTIPEKYDVVEATHKVFAEYGNVGTDFNYITQEGFGWMNASYQLGLTLLNSEMIKNLNNLSDPIELFNN